MFGPSTILTNKIGNSFELRRPEISDQVCDELSAVFNQPTVNQYISIDASTPAQVKRDLGFFQIDEGSELWLIYYDNQMAGMTYLAEWTVENDSLSHISLGTLIDLPFQRKGIGAAVLNFKLSRAFHPAIWNCNQVRNEYCLENIASQINLTRAGFVPDNSATPRLDTNRSDGRELEFLQVYLTREVWLKQQELTTIAA